MVDGFGRNGYGILKFLLSQSLKRGGCRREGIDMGLDGGRGVRHPKGCQGLCEGSCKQNKSVFFHQVWSPALLGNNRGDGEEVKRKPKTQDEKRQKKRPKISKTPKTGKRGEGG
ncbi:hypothetical protein LZ32DRAFT_120045 [Colletotrichum eremochloae]|nr:hypothetical protein LZ32DRAFT_120045 [Colletotrichum eremochloae]